MSAYGFRARTASGEIVWPTSSEYTRHSRTRRAISWEYCPPRSTTSTGRSSGAGNWTTFDGSAAIVRRLFRDRHVVRMRFAQARRSDAHEARALHLLERRGAAVPHRLPQSSDQLVQDGRERPLVEDATFDALRDELLDVLDVALEVAVLRERPRLHGADRAHAAVLLVPLALMDDHLSGRLVSAGQERPGHDRVGALGDRLREVAGRRDPSVRDHGHAGLRSDLRDVVDRRHLGHSDSGDDPRRT